MRHLCNCLVLLLLSCFAWINAETTFFDHDGLSPAEVVEYLPDSMQSIYPLIAPQRALAISSKDPKKEISCGKHSYSVQSSLHQWENNVCPEDARLQILELGKSAEAMEPIISILGLAPSIQESLLNRLESNTVALCVGKDDGSDSLVAGVCIIKNSEQRIRSFSIDGQVIVDEQAWVSACIAAISPENFTSSLKLQYEFACSNFDNQELPIVKKFGENFSGALYLTVDNEIDSFEKRVVLYALVDHGKVISLCHPYRCDWLTTSKYTQFDTFNYQKSSFHFSMNYLATLLKQYSKIKGVDFSNIQEIVDKILKNSSDANKILSSCYPVSHLGITLNPIFKRFLLENKSKSDQSKHKSKSFESKDLMVPKNIAFIKVSSFNDKKNSSTAIYYELGPILKQIKDAEDKKYVIIDLRDNSGGVFENLEECTYYFFKNKSLLYPSISDIDINNSQILPELLPAWQHKKVAVLVNKNTASSAEILAQLWKESRDFPYPGRKGKPNVVLIGEKTAGEVVVAKWYSLGYGISCLIPVQSVYTPSGKNLEGSGVIPDIVVPSGIDPIGVAKQFWSMNGSITRK